DFELILIQLLRHFLTRRQQGYKHLTQQHSSRRLLHKFLYYFAAAAIIAASVVVVNIVREQVTQAVTNPSLSVDITADRHLISPDIYGVNNFELDPTLPQAVNIPVNRWGGNAATRYNWLADSSNSGADWFFTGGKGDANPVAGASTDAFVKTNLANKTKSMLTVPMIGYVNKTGAWNCGFSVAKYGQQQETNPYIKPDGDLCGNGKTADGKEITNNNPLDVSIVSSPASMQAWLKHLVSVHGTAANGGVKFYQLDNEPSGWGNTHRDIHPKPTGYDELRDRTYQYAAMVKATDPTAKTLGPADFGWPVYVNSLLEGDREAHGGVWFAEWYLQQMKLYEQQNKVRILDYFDEHYYPIADNGCISLCPAGDEKNQALRLRSTRSLWDPTYKDESWISQYYPALQIIPLFRGWVAKNYPGTKVAITEYNWGGLESINGALAQADVLGIFGREKLDLATLWGPPKPTEPGAFAFRIYRNYDGKGSAYGDTGVRSASTDQGQLAIYGAQRRKDSVLTLVFINKTANNLTSDLALKGFNSAATAQVYSYSGANLNAIVRQPDQAVSATGFQGTYPANSITLLVIPPRIG
ncbi:MAG: glycoside hydrolase family 44 protein, partial [Coleofasciculaceae cyanobacterium]